MKRKPGEPIYLKRHILGLTLAVIAPILLPLLYHRYIAPVSFATVFIASLLIALIGSNRPVVVFCDIRSPPGCICAGVCHCGL